MKKETKKKDKKLLKLLSVILAVSVVILTAVIILFGFDIKIKVYGDEIITLQYGESYEEPGVDAIWYNSILGTKINADVTIEDNIDLKRVGSYSVKYTARKLFYSDSFVRTVRVVDTIPPEIILNHKENYFTLKGEDYMEEGYTAADNYDGDITDKVERYIKDNVVYYSVKDSSGNEAMVQRTILYNDMVPPVLTLTGSKEITIKAGSSYSEPGYTAIDEEDGNLTDKVKVEGAVDIYCSGVYTIKYTVADKYGNMSEDTRTVTVEAIKQKDTIRPQGKIIYLTFDDGPGPYTEKLLNVLEKYNVKATFFTVNTRSNYSSMLAKEAEAGHTVAIHSLTHNYAEIYKNEAAYFADLRAMSDIIEKRTGKKPMLLRFPGGSSNLVSANYCRGIMSRLTKAVTDMGYKYFDWNVDSGDASAAKNDKEVFQNVIRGVQKYNISIVLQHDSKEFSVNAVEKIIVWGISNGYTFLPLDETSPEIHHPVAN